MGEATLLAWRGELWVACSSRALVSASPPKRTFATVRHEQELHALKNRRRIRVVRRPCLTAQFRKFVAAGRRDQRAGRARYPEQTRRRAWTV